MKSYQWYSDTWGKPIKEDRHLFLLLTIGVFQAGLSWQAAASKKEVFLRNFCQMDFRKVAAFFPEDIEAIEKDPEMIRNPRKIKAVVQNARAIVGLLTEYESFADYLWDFYQGVPLIKEYESADLVPNILPEATIIAKDMKKRGFAFVGPVVTCMFLKAAGVIQDQVLDC
ncbi:DNA-3-methyladenine glycosylase I [Enterococcus sp. PF1-24]|uniref:DNA-3-methyladenine glycosylase I n=1 Tax=unclassified Enterococcus TaxID=2608891 RepID=UPI0024740879|nr:MULTISPECIES: DNA-3-methyladenine glycosylase I [unclassified Enterococcus]MDH6364269.1 DNA-3-methyladenine glycosylase I [Enterococcus sp. PFB1-1]MDH6401372.1 DNA-3-methyladenine glycosylase I [Enterococcus sp. PF1-24]